MSLLPPSASALPGFRVAAIGPEGRAKLTGGAEKSLVYITQTKTGEQETLTPEEFAGKYGWKN